MTTETHTVPIIGLSCGGGGALSLEHALGEMDGILTAWVNPATETAYVTLDPERILMRDVIRTIEACGYAAGACRDP
jgi:copper chaperone CopZ